MYAADAGFSEGAAGILLAVVATLIGFLAAVVPPLVEQVTEFATNLPDYVQNLAESNPRIERYVNDKDIAARLEEATSKVPGNIGSSIGGVVGVAGSVIAIPSRVSEPSARRHVPHPATSSSTTALNAMKAMPQASAVNFQAARTRANNAIQSVEVRVV